MKNTILYTLGAIIIVVVGFYGGIFIGEKASNITSKDQKAEVVDTTIKEDKAVEVERPKTTTLMFVGDMMLARSVETSVKKNFNGDYSKLFENIPEIKNADILFANLEGPVSDVGNNVGSKYSFRMDPSVLPVIKNAGFDIVSFANNHIGDWNTTAFADTLKRLTDNGILKTGAGMNKKEVETPTIIEKNGIKFGYIGVSDVGPEWMEATDTKGGILLASDPLIREIIKNAKTQSDVLIVSIHWGEEYKTIHNSHQEELAKMLIDSGADMIIGHHPHVIEDIGKYKDKPIVYSLGNFIFDQYFSKNTMRGMVYQATFESNTLKSTDSKIITLNKYYQPNGIFTKDEVREADTLTSGICEKPTKEYEDMSLLPIGQDTVLPDTTYIPKDLRDLSDTSSIRTGICLTKEARDSFESMATKAKEDGINIKASSGFRSFETQKKLLQGSIKSGNKNASIAIAKAGYSEHQLGTAVDITGGSINYSTTSGKFYTSSEYDWMTKNASDFGFVESYPKDKESITGYMYEPWHYRYVGIDNAKEIIKNGETIIEFLKKQI